MEPTKKTVFVSYMHEVTPRAQEIVHKLEELGYSVWEVQEHT